MRVTRESLLRLGHTDSDRPPIVNHSSTNKQIREGALARAGETAQIKLQILLGLFVCSHDST